MSNRKICPHGCEKEWIGPSNRHASSPLDPDATAAANEASAANCERLKNPDGSIRQLTMSEDDYACRRVWMDAYLGALDKKKGPPRSKTNDTVIPCPKAYLIVQVKDFDGKPVKDAIVNVQGLGGSFTDQEGLADYGEVTPSQYEITAEKDKHRPKPDQPAGPAETSAEVPACQTTVVPLQLDPLEVILRENIIFIGSEESYDSFWLKMMFVAAAYVEAGRGEKFRTADKKTIGYVDHGYTKAEKLTLDFLRDKRGFNVIKIGSVGEIVSYLNDRPEKRSNRGRKEKTLIQDVAFFSHGKPHSIMLNYNASPDVDFTEGALSQVKKDVFVPDGRIYSYACRTGIGDDHWLLSYDDDADAEPEKSLAQKMANHFKVEVHAFLRKTYYGYVLRRRNDAEEEKAIVIALKEGRKNQEGKIIDIPPEHEGLPHPGLADGSGPREEGTNEYALWRKTGGRELPRADQDPKGVSASMRLFKPK